MKSRTIILLLAAGTLLLFCNCAYGKINRKPKATPTVNIQEIQIDNAVKNHLGDSIAKIIFNADTVKLLSLSVEPIIDSLKTNPAQTDSTITPNFHGCFIKHNYGVLSKAEIYPALLILSDKDNYLNNDVRLKSPFIPDVALSFKRNYTSIDVVFSFTGGQLFIFTEDEERIYVKYNYERLLMKFFQAYLKDERITEYLNL